MKIEGVDEARSQQMRLIKSRDTKPELKIRRALFALGYRYRLHSAKLPGKPDLIFPKRKKLIFVHGCFWHRHPGCKKNRMPKTRLEYWLPKFARNVERDEQNQSELTALGWQYLIVWECELRDLETILVKVRAFLETDKEKFTHHT